MSVILTQPPEAAQKQKTTFVQRISNFWQDFLDYAQGVKKPGQKLGWQDWAIAAVAFALVSLLRLAALALYDDSRGVQYFLYDWDGKNYLAIAEYGYFTEDGTGDPEPKIYERRLAFFPALPMLIRVGHEIFGLSYLASGLIITNVFGYLAVVGVMALLARMGQDRYIRTLGALLFLGAPMAITLNMVYTEPIFLALMIWAMVALLDQRLFLATLLIFCAGFTRLTAVDLVLAFAIVVFFQYRTNPWAWVGVVVSSFSIISHITWVGTVSGDSGSYFDIQRNGWSSSFDFGLSSILWIGRTFEEGPTWTMIIAALCIIGSTLAVVLSYRRIPFVYWIMASGIVANVVLSGGFFHSRPRLLFPAMILLLPLVLSARSYPRWVVHLLMGLWILHSVAFGAYMLVVSPYAI